MKSIINRIRYIPIYLRIKETEFEETIGVSKNYLRITENRKGDPGVSILEKVHSAYPHLNLYWIITGTGGINLKPSSVLNEPHSKYELSENSHDNVSKAVKNYILNQLESLENKLDNKYVLK